MMETIKISDNNFNYKKELAQKLLEFLKYKLVKSTGDVTDFSETKKKFNNSVPNKKEFGNELRKNGDKELAYFIEEVLK